MKIEGIEFCDYGCGEEAKFQLKNGKWCCGSNVKKCRVIRDKSSKTLIGIIKHDSIQKLRTQISMEIKKRKAMKRWD